MLENAVEGIARLDPEGYYVTTNQAYAGMVGYAPEEMIGMTWPVTVHVEDREKMSIAYQQLLDKGRVEVEARGVRKDGSVFHKQVVMIATYNEQQKFAGHFCFMRDITERKGAEEALIESDRRFRDLFYDAPVGYHELDTEGRITCVNTTELLMLGYIHRAKAAV